MERLAVWGGAEAWSVEEVDFVAGGEGEGVRGPCVGGPGGAVDEDHWGGVGGSNACPVDGCFVAIAGVGEDLG